MLSQLPGASFAPGQAIAGSISINTNTQPVGADAVGAEPADGAMLGRIRIPEIVAKGGVEQTYPEYQDTLKRLMPQGMVK